MKRPTEAEIDAVNYDPEAIALPGEVTAAMLAANPRYAQPFKGAAEKLLARGFRVAVHSQRKTMYIDLHTAQGQLIATVQDGDQLGALFT